VAGDAYESRFRGQPRGYISLGLLDIDCPQSMHVVVVFGMVVFVNNYGKVVEVEDTGDRDEGVRAGVIRDESKGGVPKL
jgi:hypothetical protein